jgi:hypothetical protein
MDENQEEEEQIDEHEDDNHTMNDTLEPPQQTDTDNTVMAVDTNESITN